LSVLGHGYPNSEYLILDAESTDNSVSIIKKYLNQLNYWVSEKDNGQSDAINKGFEKATGEILLWLNSNDILMPNVMYFIAEQYLEKGDGIYFGKFIHFKENKNGKLSTAGSNVLLYTETPLELLDTIIQPSYFWSKKVWIKNDILQNNLHFAFDWEWFLRAQKNGIQFFPLSKTLSLYRLHDSLKTASGGIKD
jgi:glycosyltransferase involved in cell wall biosynthesis